MPPFLQSADQVQSPPTPNIDRRRPQSAPRQRPPQPPPQVSNALLDHVVSHSLSHQIIFTNRQSIFAKLHHGFMAQLEQFAMHIQKVWPWPWTWRLNLTFRFKKQKRASSNTSGSCECIRTSRLWWIRRCLSGSSKLGSIQQYSISFSSDGFTTWRNWMSCCIKKAETGFDWRNQKKLSRKMGQDYYDVIGVIFRSHDVTGIIFLEPK